MYVKKIDASEDIEKLTSNQKEAEVSVTINHTPKKRTASFTFINLH